MIDEGAFGSDTQRTPGSFSFHNGVDISAPTGTAVFPVVSGTVHLGYGDEVIVDTTDGRIFQYFHVDPMVRAGQHVVAYLTLLGHTLPRWRHVHLTEIDGFRVHNPLDPGHLEPYHDRTIPVVADIHYDTENGRDLKSTELHAKILISAKILDATALPVPWPWYGFPVTPALVTWRLETNTRRVVIPTRVVGDFRRTEPPKRDFWRVYAAGTYQNFPAFGDKYFYRKPGRYLFNLTPRPLDTRQLPDGSYVLVVTAADVCSNHATRHAHIRIHNQGPRLNRRHASYTH